MRAALALLLAASAARAGALEETAAALAARVRDGLTDPTPTTIMVACEGPDEAAALFCGALAFRLAAFAPAVLRAGAGQEGLSGVRAAGADTLVRARVALMGDDLVVSAEALPAWVNFWTGQPDPPGSPLIAILRAAAEPELKLLMGALPPAPGRLSVRPLGRIEAGVEAMAIGDLDGDGTAELAVLTPQSVRVFRFADKALLPLAERSLADFPRALRPPRAPAGSAVVTRVAGTPVLAVRELGRARGALLALRGNTLVTLDDLDDVPLCAGAAGVLWGTQQPGTLLYQPQLSLRGPDAPRHSTLPAPVVAAASARNAPQMAVVLESGAVWLLDAKLARAPAPVATAGAALALADLDGDGALELVTSRPSAPGEEDRAAVWALDGKAIYEGPASGAPILAAAAGDLTGDGRDDVALAAVEPHGTWISLLTVDGEKIAAAEPAR